MGFPPSLRAGTDTFSSLDRLKGRKCVCLRVQSLTEKLNTVLLGKGDLLSAAEGHLRVENRKCLEDMDGWFAGVDMF